MAARSANTLHPTDHIVLHRPSKVSLGTGRTVDGRTANTLLQSHRRDAESDPWGEQGGGAQLDLTRPAPGVHLPQPPILPSVLTWS